MRIKLVTILFSLLVVSSLGAHDSNLSLYIDSSEGGNISQRQLGKLTTFLNLNNCSIGEVVTGTNNIDNPSADILIYPLLQVTPNIYTKISDLSILGGPKISASIMVRKATGITDISELKNIRFAFLSENSKTGYKLQKELMQQIGIIQNPNKIMFTQTNVGAVSLLLHKDVFAAGVATPLAKKWAEDNDLTILAQSNNLKVGGIWVKKSISQKMVYDCSEAFSKLSKNTRRNRSILKVFPEWVQGFSVRKN